MRIAGCAHPLLDALVPARCHHCEARIAPGPWAPFLCPRCGSGVPPTARPIMDVGGDDDPPVRALAELAGPLRTLVHAAKYRGNLAVGRRLGRALGTALRCRADALVPVPLHWRRRWRRGHDQARVLCRGVAAAAGLPCWPALRRARPTAPQVGLGEDDRARNLRGAFEPRPASRRRLRGRRVLLVDDVVTTGATCRAARWALEEAEARVAGILVAAWMPSPTRRGTESGARSRWTVSPSPR